MNPMIKAAKRQVMGFVKVSDVFYSDSISGAIEDEDAIYFFQCKEQYKSTPAFHTLHITPQNEDALLASFNRRTRSDIKKMIKDKDIERTLVDHFERTEDTLIQEFTNFYNEFAKAKGICLMDMGLIRNMIDLDRMVISKVTYKGETICMHSYICNNERMRSQHSCSVRLDHGRDKEFRNLVARANRWLHFQDLIYAYDRGFEVYDFGGLALEQADESLVGVDEFKLGFGGRKIDEYNFLFPVTFKGKVFKLFKMVLSDHC